MPINVSKQIQRNRRWVGPGYSQETPTGGQGAWCQLGRTSKYRGGQQEETPGNVPSISLNTKTQHPAFAQETFNHFMHKVRFSLMLLLIQDRRNNAVNVCRYLDPPFTELEISRGRRSQCKCGGSAAPSAVYCSIGSTTGFHNHVEGPY